MAMVWTMLFLQIELFRPGSFTGLGRDNLASEFTYFSLITITSLGYGVYYPPVPLRVSLQVLKLRVARST
jgi:hypothetical protein